MDLDTFVRNTKFPTNEMMEDTLLKLNTEGIAVNQISSLTKDECEEIGLSAETLEILTNAVKDLKVRVKNFRTLHSSSKRKLKQDDLKKNLMQCTAE